MKQKLFLGAAVAGLMSVAAVGCGTGQKGDSAAKSGCNGKCSSKTGCKTASCNAKTASCNAKTSCKAAK